ncbi:MAG: hypothetical protein H7247_00870 [Polaromonas sp.]|nr:hypothetical protein [Gemmatimonadaceae bacterium]
MSSLDRTTGSDVRLRHLPQDERMLGPALLARSGGTARTLVKAGRCD